MTDFLLPRIQEPPFAMLAPQDGDEATDVEGGTTRQYRGYLVDLVEALSKYAKFTYSISVVHDRQRGSLRPDGTWTGLVGELVAGVSDASGSRR